MLKGILQFLKLLRTTAIFPLNDYFTELSLLVSSSQWRGSRMEREFTSLPGNRQFKIVIKRIKEKKISYQK